MTVHELPDDFGRAGTEASEKGGSAGPRLACCNLRLVTKAEYRSLFFEDYYDVEDEYDEDDILARIKEELENFDSN